MYCAVCFFASYSYTGEALARTGAKVTLCNCLIKTLLF